MKYKLHGLVTRHSHCWGLYIDTVLVRYTEVKYQLIFFKNMNTKFDEMLSEINRVLQKEMLKLTISAWKFKHA